MRPMFDVNYDFFCHTLFLVYSELVAARIETKDQSLSDEFWDRVEELLYYFTGTSTTRLIALSIFYCTHEYIVRVSPCVDECIHRILLGRELLRILAELHGILHTTSKYTLDSITSLREA